MPDIDISGGIDLACFHYQVEADGEAKEKLDESRAYGETVFSKQIIRVTPQFGPDRLRETFLHETLEIINENLCDSKLKHSAIKLIARGFAQVFKGLGVNFVVKSEH